MGLFDFFKKKETAPEAQEALDKGLEKTKDGFFNKITKAVAGKSSVDDEVLDNLEEVLVTSDVGVSTTLKSSGASKSVLPKINILTPLN